MNPQVQRLQTEFVPVAGDTPVEARTGDSIAKMASDQVVLVYEVIMVRKDHVLARVIGPHKAGTPVKMQMPLNWTGAGNVVFDAPYALYTKKGAEPAGSKGKGKAVKKGGGPKPKDGGVTKIAKCREIFKANPNLSKVDMCALFIKDAECTTMGANTYYLTVSKEK